MSEKLLENYYGQNIMLFVLCVALVGSHQFSPASGDDQLPVIELINRYSESMSWHDESFSMRVEADIRGQASSSIFTETSIWCTGGELLLQGRGETRDREGHTHLNSSYALPTTHLTSDFAWKDTTPDKSRSKTFYRSREVDKSWREFWFSLTAGCILDGFAPGSNDQSVIDLLRASPDLSVDPDIKEINGIPCLLVQGTTDQGIVRVWLDPSHNYTAIKYSIRKEKNHLFNALPLDKALIHLDDASPIVLWEAELVDGVLASFGNKHLISSGELRITRTHADGQVNIIRFLLHRYDIDLSPPDNAVHTRFNTLLEDGSEIIDADAPGLVFQWQDEKLKPKYHPIVVSYVQNTIELYQGKQDIDPLMDPVKCSALEDAFCGLYCIYAAGQLTHKEFAFPSLLRPEYIGSHKGSSIAELKRAAQDHSLFAAAFENASVSDLESNSNPIVLYVKSKPSDPNPNHFVLFLEAKPDGAMIFEPPSENSLPNIRKIPYFELASIWNGKGLLLSTESIAESNLLVSARRRAFFIVIGILVVMGIIKFIAVKWQARARLRPTRQLMIRSVGQTVALIVIAASISFVFHVNAKGGFFSDPDSATFISGTISRPSIEKLSVEELRGTLASGSAVLIDARSPEAFELEHIPGAINLPLGLSKSHRDAKLREFPLDTLLVTYCDPNGCPLSGRLALVLLRDGFSNIRVLEGDWKIETQSQ